MEREFPKNVRQIGNVSDEPKIYMEDYVDTYLNQLKKKPDAEPACAVLTGEILSMDGQDVVYVAGALELSGMTFENGEVTVNDEAWKTLEEEKNRFFSGQDMVGWCLIGSGQPMTLTRGINRTHEKLFDRENTIFVWRDAIEPEELICAHKFGELMQIGGYYIFYEKNPSMQSYMINTRKKIGVTPSEVVEDRAAKNFRSVIKEKGDYRDQRQGARFVYAMSVMLVVVVLAIGVSAINNYDKMESVQNSLETLSQAVARAPAHVTAGEDVDADTDSGEETDFREPEDRADTDRADADRTDESESDAGADTDGSAGKETSGQAYPGDYSMPDTTDIAESGGYYVVQSGDTLDGISLKMYGTRRYVDAICRMNGLSDGNLIITGQKLLLP